MGKGAGSLRVSKWEGNIYTENGVRKEYGDLSPGRKAAVRAEYKSVANAMHRNLANKSVLLEADNKFIDVGFTRKGLEHVARDAMLTLSGKYMSRSSMVHIDRILAKAEYVPTDHKVYKERKDGKEMFFRYKDKTGRGIYFKVAYEPKQGQGKRYSLYSVSDNIKEG